MSSDIKSYEFQSFDSEIIKDGESVESYSFAEFKEGQFFEKKETSKIIKLEREYAGKNNFSLSPIVKEYRGHTEQEKEEKERKIHDQVQKRVDEIREKAYQEGFQEGVNQGRDEVFKQTRAETEEKMAALVTMINEVLSLKDQIVSHQKSEISKMVKILTKWVILRELKDDGEYVERLFEKLILEMQTKSNLLVKVNQQEFEKMPEVLEHVEKKLGELKNVRVEVDYDINDQDHGMILESENGIVNGTLEEQFKSLDKLFEVVGVDE